MILVYRALDLKYPKMETLQSQEAGFNDLKLPLNFTHYSIYETKQRDIKLKFTVLKHVIFVLSCKVKPILFMRKKQIS